MRATKSLWSSCEILRLCDQSFRRVWLFAITWAITHQGFPRQEYWSGLPFYPPEDLPNPHFLHWQADFSPLHHLGSPHDASGCPQRPQWRELSKTFRAKGCGDWIGGRIRLCLRTADTTVSLESLANLEARVRAPGDALEGVTRQLCGFSQA